jgi:CMP/dCMP kinase
LHFDGDSVVTPLYFWACCRGRADFSRHVAMIIAIDGPTASGKGTLGRRLAAHYGLRHLDTGLLYRAVAESVLARGHSLDDTERAVAAALTLDVSRFDEEVLKSHAAGEAASVISAIPEVREALLQFQQDFAALPPGAVLEGRDIGTVICPNADVKIFVTASPETRARRRTLDMGRRGYPADESAILADIKRRDQRDTQRAIAPLMPAADAHVLDTSHLDVETVVREAVRIVERAVSPAVSEQSPAPIRVEERNGKIAQATDRDSQLLSPEADFNAWREPVIDHVRELLAGDFRQGTNHSRARDRLVALGRLLPGDVSDVKERQFRIGYEIERLNGLIAAYESGGSNMPDLDAAVLEDLKRLLVALRLGIDKLERWAEFRRAAAIDPMREGDADPTVVSSALEEMAVKMEQLPKYFDPELPGTFRFLAEAAKDQGGATKTIVFGAVRSAENLLRFLARRAVGIATKAADGVEQQISSAVAAFLISSLAAAALQVSGALPTAWGWLKPLLDLIGKSAGN